MNDTLIRDLSDNDAYPHPADDVEVHQTHISVVFLAGEFAYKLKKPLDLEFVDYSTLEKRRYFCEREIELNERLAPDVYLDVVPIYFDDTADTHRIGEATDDHAEVVEWAVRMKRLEERKTLHARLEADDLPPDTLSRLGKKIAKFHQQARQAPEISACGGYSTVEKNALDNFRQSRAHIGETVDPDVFERLQTKTREELARLQALINKRAEQNVPKDTHGDLRLEHVYIEDDGTLFIVDCIEFNDAFRYADPICDTAFLAMDLGVRGFDEEADQFLHSYFNETDDEEGRQLLDFYVAYRSCVRAKVRGVKSQAEEIPRAQRASALQKARAHWLYALATLDPEDGPALLLLAGLPGTGKSTLGRKIIGDSEVQLLLESDAIRKELAGLDLSEDARADIGAGIYTEEFTERTYTELLSRARDALIKGTRVAIAATFTRDKYRRQMIMMARELGVPVRFIECVIPEELAYQRLDARKDDVSDADKEVYDALKDVWEQPSPLVERVHEKRDTSH